MKRCIPLTALAGVLACLVAAGTAQAAPASGSVLGQLTTAKQASVAVEQVGWRPHHRWWKKRHYRRDRFYRHNNRRWR
jgi:hypothetical protein